MYPHCSSADEALSRPPRWIPPQFDAQRPLHFFLDDDADPIGFIDLYHEMHDYTTLAEIRPVC